MPTASTAASSRASTSRTASGSGRAAATATDSSSCCPTRTCCWCCRRRASWRWSRRRPTSSRSWGGSPPSRARRGTTLCWPATCCWLATARRWPPSGWPGRAADRPGPEPVEERKPGQGQDEPRHRLDPLLDQRVDDEPAGDQDEDPGNQRIAKGPVGARRLGHLVPKDEDRRRHEAVEDPGREEQAVGELVERARDGEQARPHGLDAERPDGHAGALAQVPHLLEEE